MSKWEAVETFDGFTGDAALFLYKDRSGVQAVRRGHHKEFPFNEAWFELDYSDEGLLGMNSYSHWMPLPLPPEEPTQIKD